MIILNNFFRILFLATAIMSLSFTPIMASDVKAPNLAGSWYPESKEELTKLLRGYLDSVNPEKVEGRIFALISPHAGYRFSGSMAAYGYKLAENRDIKTVVIIGFSHRKIFDGIAIYDRGAFRTPLGDIAVDSELAASIRSRNGRIYFQPEAFNGENSVEMQVPFIQLAFPGASIVPIAFGTQDYSDAEILAGALAAALEDRKDCLIVASTDLSHYHPYDEANLIDGRLIVDLSNMNAGQIFEAARLGKYEACGIMPIAATLLAGEKLGFKDVKILKYANSGDISGDKSRVVGYVSAVIYKGPRSVVDSPGKEGEKQMLLNESQRKRLLDIARGSIKSFVDDRKRASFTEGDPVLNKPFGAFVTLKESGELRGCIGNMMAQGPLYQTVADMAIQAATGDPRFKALSPGEIDKVALEISVLSPLKKISNIDEIKIPGHGVLVRRKGRSGVYLPQVAVEAGWNKEKFMTSLCANKAGLPPDAWKDPSTDVYIFEAEVFGEE
ncbi:MAG: AmmeMemoRadiSam system protein B [Candidatus Omnitrophica bacterium]|nr:AmmeMemoRadiSam system protein B [Candidatus Omnitrophota bacterium]